MPKFLSKLLKSDVCSAVTAALVSSLILLFLSIVFLKITPDQFNLEIWAILAAGSALAGVFGFFEGFLQGVITAAIPVLISFLVISFKEQLGIHPGSMVFVMLAVLASLRRLATPVIRGVGAVGLAVSVGIFFSSPAVFIACLVASGIAVVNCWLFLRLAPEAVRPLRTLTRPAYWYVAAFGFVVMALLLIFACIYQIVHVFDPQSFDYSSACLPREEQPNFSEFFYQSIWIFTTGGAPFTPKTRAARWWVSLELLLAVAVTVIYAAVLMNAINKVSGSDDPLRANRKTE